MNADIKQLWIDALRSGKYKQGYGRLRDEEDTETQFCCLGVLCDLHAKATGAGSWGGDSYFAGGVQENQSLPRTVVWWAELNDDNPAIDDNNNTLAEYNDGSDFADIRQHSFAEIADLIEQRL
jgi:hypothetical protein